MDSTSFCYNYSEIPTYLSGYIFVHGDVESVGSSLRLTPGRLDLTSQKLEHWSHRSSGTRLSDWSLLADCSTDSTRNFLGKPQLGHNIGTSLSSRHFLLVEHHPVSLSIWHFVDRVNLLQLAFDCFHYGKVENDKLLSAVMTKVFLWSL